MNKSIRTRIQLNDGNQFATIGRMVLYLSGLLSALAWVAFGTWVFYHISGGGGMHLKSDLTIIFLAFYIPALIGTIGLTLATANHLLKYEPSTWHSLSIAIGIIIMTIAYVFFGFSHNADVLGLSMLPPIISGTLLIIHNIRWKIQTRWSSSLYQ